jgi:PBSX family phage terminase large subunit
MIDIAPIEVYKLPQFDALYNPPAGTNVIVCIGGRGGAKTYEVSKYIAYSATVLKKRCVVLRDEKELIRESILNEVLLRYDTADEFGALSIDYSRLDTGIKDKATNEMLVFTKGFRASQNNKRANLKSISNIDIAVIEEAEDIRDVEKFNTFADSIRKEESLIIIILNTPDVNHWLIKRYFNLEPARDEAGNMIDGYFAIIPKQIPGFLCIQTSFTDNPYLPSHIISNYNNYGNPGSHLYNPHYYYTAIKGFASTGRKGQILTKVKPISLHEYLRLPFKEIYGQDFGTASPAGMVGVKFDKNNCYCRQINYLPMDTLSIARMYCTLKLNSTDKIIADSAEPETIKRLKSGYNTTELPEPEFTKYPMLQRGFFVEPAVKGTGSIEAGIGLMTGMNLFAVEESMDLWNEIYNWIYAVDKNKTPTDQPEDNFNHLIDPWRYVVTAYKGNRKNNLSGQMGYFR